LRKARCGIGAPGTKQTFGTRLALPFGENRFGIANKPLRPQYGAIRFIKLLMRSTVEGFCVVIGLQPALTSSMPRRSTSLSCLVLSTSQYISTIIGELAFHGARVEQRHQKRHTVPFAETPLLLCTREIPCCLTPVRTCLYLESRRPQRRLQTARRVLHTSLTIQETADRPNVILKAA
jgi:hypothetical protein